MCSKRQQNRNIKRALESLADEVDLELQPTIPKLSKPELGFSSPEVEQNELSNDYHLEEDLMGLHHDLESDDLSDSCSYYSCDEGNSDLEDTDVVEDDQPSPPTLANELLYFVLLFNLPRTAVQFLLTPLQRYGVDVPPYVPAGADAAADAYDAIEPSENFRTSVDCNTPRQDYFSSAGPVAKRLRLGFGGSTSASPLACSNGASLGSKENLPTPGGDAGQVDSLVLKKGLRPYTVEAAYFVASLALRRMIALQDSMERFVRASRETDNNENAVLRTPIETHEELHLFLREIDDSEFKKAVIRELFLVGGTTLKNFITAAVGKLLTINMQTKFNRHGTEGKNRFIGPLENVVRMAARRAHPGATDRNVTDAIMSTLKNAADREGGRKRRQERKAAD